MSVFDLTQEVRAIEQMQSRTARRVADEREAAFQEYLKHSAPYDAAIREAGDLPWHEDPERLARVAQQLGLPEDSEPLTVRRALFNRHHRSNR